MYIEVIPEHNRTFVPFDSAVSMEYTHQMVHKLWLQANSKNFGSTNLTMGKVKGQRHGICCYMYWKGKYEYSNINSSKNISQVKVFVTDKLTKKLTNKVYVP